MEAVIQLYNDLFTLESKINKGSYPIHKKLSGGKDIYEIILSSVDFSKAEKILDAGCGVGFGSRFLASKTKGEVHGITISDQEYNRAVDSNKDIANLSFMNIGFEDLESNAYDIIICVESLKHSLHYEKAFQKLGDALKSIGQLIIVEDFFQATREDETSKQFMNDWQLNYLISESILEKYYSLESKQDLTHLMKIKSKIHIFLKLSLFKIMSLFKPTNYVKLFRGGILLDKLYSEGKMKYGMNVYSKKSDSQA